MATTTHAFNIQIEGMSCASCVMRVEKALKKVPGVAEAQVNLATERAQVTGGAELQLAPLLAAVEKAGYGAQPVVESRPPSRASCPAAGRWWPVPC